MKLVEYNGRMGIWVRKKGGYAIFIDQEDIDPVRLGINPMAEYSSGYKGTVKWDDGKTNTYSTNHPNISVKGNNSYRNAENEYSKKLLGRDAKTFKSGSKVLLEDTYTGKYNIKSTYVREATLEEKQGRMNTSMRGHIVKDASGRESLVSDIRIKSGKYTDNEKTAIYKGYPSTIGVGEELKITGYAGKSKNNNQDLYTATNNKGQSKLVYDADIEMKQLSNYLKSIKKGKK